MGLPPILWADESLDPRSQSLPSIPLFGGGSPFGLSSVPAVGCLKPDVPSMVTYSAIGEVSGPDLWSSSATGASAPAKTPTLSIVTATLNERYSLPDLLDQISRLPLPPYEVIVVDDGSIDGTREFLLDAANRDSRVRPVFNRCKQSLLRAHSQGIQAARGQFVVILDADLQHPPGVLPAIVDRLESGAGIVVASRYTNGGSTGAWSLYREIVSNTARYILKAFLPNSRKVSDPASGYFGLMRRNFVPVDPRWRGFKLLPFVLASASSGVSIVEVPYTFDTRSSGDSKIVGRNLRFVRVFLTEVVLAVRFSRLSAFYRRSFAPSSTDRGIPGATSDVVPAEATVPATAPAPTSTGPRAMGVRFETMAPASAPRIGMQASSEGEALT